jgi:ABC-type glycerol-3-phosphate transport system permease component
VSLLNSPIALIAPQVTRSMPLAVLLLWAALRALPADVLAAAEVDGAAPRHVLARVALPLAAPMVAVVGLWAFLSSWNEFLLPTVVMQDEGLQTVPTALAHFVGRVDTQYALLATGALLSVLPLLALYGTLYGAMSAGLGRLRRGPGWT